MRRRPDLATLRAAWWARRAAGEAQRLLAVHGLRDAPSIAPPPPLPSHARRGVVSMLRRMGVSCLIRAVVVQTWDAAHGHRRDLVVGVTAPGTGFQAHAWLEGDAACYRKGFSELLRRAPH